MDSSVQQDGTGHRHNGLDPAFGNAIVMMGPDPSKIDGLEEPTKMLGKFVASKSGGIVGMVVMDNDTKITQ